MNWVIVRADSGVYFGNLITLDGTKAELEHSRQLWYWKTRGLNCLDIAVKGLEEGSKICSQIDKIIVLDARAIASVESSVAVQLQDWPAWTP